MPEKENRIRKTDYKPLDGQEEKEYNVSE